MKTFKKFEKQMLLAIMIVAVGLSGAWAADYKKVDSITLLKYKKPIDDPRPLGKELTYKKVLSPEVYAKLTWDVPTMRKAWADVVGFSAPGVVGKISPEIKPGKYTYKDVESNKALKELVIPYFREHFIKPAGPPFIGNFTEFTIIPTRQLYYQLPVAQATKKNQGKTKLNDKGYIVDSSYESGIPFPRPSGNYKAQQVVYNWIKRYWDSEGTDSMGIFKGFNKSLNLDFDGLIEIKNLRLSGRVIIPPFGYFDQRAKERKEGTATLLTYQAPRDQYGTALNIVTFESADQVDSMSVFVNSLRRVRKMSATDTQDALGGQDIIYDDNGGFGKLCSNRNPYKLEIVAEREYLVPVTTDTSIYYSSKGMELKNVEMERRPVYVIKMIQQDKNYVYSYRIAYFDRENFLLYHIENYDQKGRLYRTNTSIQTFIPEMGMTTERVVISRDHVDLHSSTALPFITPIVNVKRGDVSLEGMIKRGK